MEALNEIPDVFDTPCRDPWAELDGLRETARLDPLPPSRFAHWNPSGDRRARPWVAYDLGQAEVTGVRELVHLGLIPSKVGRLHPVRASPPRIAGRVTKTRQTVGR
jgi:hypothetical protein